MKQYDRASEKYREVLQLAGKHENRFNTDTLQVSLRIPIIIFVRGFSSLLKIIHKIKCC